MGVGEWQGLREDLPMLRRIFFFGGGGDRYFHYFDCGDGFAGANMPQN